MDEETLRARAVDVLGMAADQLGRDRRAGQGLVILAERLSDPAVAFSPMRGHPEEMVRAHLGQAARSCAGLREGVAALVPGAVIDPATVEALEDAVRGARERLAATVTYGDVERALAGSWGDDRLSAAIEGLSRAFADRVARGPADGGGADAPELRARALALARQARAVFRPGSVRNEALGALAARLDGPGASLTPRGGPGGAVAFADVVNGLACVRDMNDLGEDVRALEADLAP